VFAYIEEYTDQTKAALGHVQGLVLHTPLPYEQSSGIVTFSLTGHSAAEIHERLQQEKILAAPLELDGTKIRVSTHVFNNQSDLERLVHAIDGIARGKR